MRSNNKQKDYSLSSLFRQEYISIFRSTFLIDTITLNTPCGLTQEELDAHNWLDNDTGRCNAPYEDEDGVEKRGSGKLYASHPSSAQGK